jgi:hypothetical protein
LPYSSTLPAASVRGTGGYISQQKRFSTTSEPNLIDKNTIDHITKFGEISPNSRKLNDDEILLQPIVLDLDNGKYFSLGDANPMTQTILERAHGNGSMIGLRHNSILRKASMIDKSLSKSETNLANQNDDENESTSSESSSHTTPISSSSVTSKSSISAGHGTTSLTRQITKFVVRRFLRKGKNRSNYEHRDSGDNDDEEDAERILINDGSNGDLKYKASRYLKEQAQFDKTQLLQTIVNAHRGPIWCMR